MVLSEIQPLLLLRNQPPSPLSAKYEIEMEGGTLKHTGSSGGDEEVAGNHDTTTARSSSVDEPPPLPSVNAHPQQPHHHNSEEQDESTAAAYHDKSQLLQTPSQYYTTHHPHHPPQDSALRDFAHLATTPGLTPHHGSTSGSGGVGRNIFTQQPHPSSSQSTTPHQSILKPSTYGQSSVKNAPSSSSTLNNNTDNDTAASNTLVGLSTMGLLRGENALMPTPVVRRGEGAASSSSNNTTNVDDDPAAASTPYAQQQQEYNLFQPGIHYHQGMVPQSEMKSVAELKARGVTKKGYWRDDTVNSSGGSGGGGVLNYEQKEERAVDTMNTSQSNRMSTNEATSTESNPQSNPTPTTTSPPQQQQPPPMLNEFPFLFDGYAGWVCRHCSHIPYYYRGPNYVWKNPQPPPNYFVDHHLMFCPGLNASVGRNVEGLLKSQQLAQQQLVQGGGGGRMVVGTPEGRNMNWNSGGSGLKQQQQQRKLDPPTGRSPKAGAVDGGSVVKKKKRRQSNEEEEDGEEGTTTSLPTPMLPNTATKDQAFWSSQWNSFQQQQQSYHHHPSSATATPTSTSQLMPPGYSPPAASYSQQQFVPHPPSQSLQPSGTSSLKRKSPKRRSTAVAAENEPRSHSKQQKERPTRRPYQHKSPAGIPSNDQRYKEAYQLLSTAADKIPKATSQSNSDIGTSLVKVEDTELLTDYFYYMMMQLVVCRFSERDKKTRGGKRDNIAIGYGGLQCIHCSTNDYSRKFYWSTVDRLANSFAEIPAHVLKCKSCPVEVRDALLVLKDRHSTQMASRPRGSQKVFFRRVWRRLHSGDIDAAAAENASTTSASMGAQQPQQPSSLLLGGFASSPQLATCVNVESALKSPEIASGTAAKLLKASMDISSPEKERRVVLALPQDKDWLSDMDCFVRNNIEIFSATTNDVSVAKEDKKYPIKLGQVGLRCVHCASSANGARREAVMYPYSVSGIYESVRDFQKLHLDYCPHLPHELRMAMGKLTHGCSSLSSVLRRYYVQAARALGLFDSEDGGIRAGGTVIPMISSGFTIGEAGNSRKRGSSSQQVVEEEDGRMMMTPGQAVKRQKVTRTEEV